MHVTLLAANAPRFTQFEPVRTLQSGNARHHALVNVDSPLASVVDQQTAFFLDAAEWKLYVVCSRAPFWQLRSTAPTGSRRSPALSQQTTVSNLSFFRDLQALHISLTQKMVKINNSLAAEIGCTVAGALCGSSKCTAASSVSV